MARKQRNNGRIGRVGYYDTRVKPYFKEIEEMCKTKTEKQIAASLGVAYGTWNQYKVDHEELCELLKNGRQNLVNDLRSSLIKKAHGYEYTETKVVTEEVKWPEEMYEALLDAGFTPKQIAQSKIVKTEVAHKEFSPDVAALNLALKNYDKENWANDPQMLALRKKELELKEKQIDNNNW